MNNGFTTVEEGRVRGQQLKLRLVDIGRISFSRDLPVHNVRLDCFALMWEKVFVCSLSIT